MKAIQTCQPAALVATIKNEARADSRVLAVNLGKQHKSTFALVNRYRTDLELLGKVLFQMEASNSGQVERYALVNEDQAYLLLTYTRNTPKVRALKIKLVQAFRDTRLAAELRTAEYLPSYHALHEQVHTLAAGSTNERHVHSNVNRLLNKVAGIESGQRARAALPSQSVLIVAQALAAGALHGASDHRDGYARIKAAVEPLGAALRLQG